MRNNRSEHVANVALSQHASIAQNRTRAQRVASPFNVYNALRVAVVIVVLSCIYNLFH